MDALSARGLEFAATRGGAPGVTHARAKAAVLCLLVSLWPVPTRAAEHPLDAALTAFYNARYDEAAALAQDRLAVAPEDLEAYEVRTPALLFQIRRAHGPAGNREKALNECQECAALLKTFLEDVKSGQRIARERLRANPEDEEALFLLGKIDLTYVWLHLGPLGRRAGWDEYREARRSLDKALEKNPGHVRARIAHAWMEYIVDTRVPWGLKWIVGGGNRKRALAAVREAASAESDWFVRAEARFALWEMELRERNSDAAHRAAEDLLRDFPANKQLAEYVDSAREQRR
jgi:hypothetical protein